MNKEEEGRREGRSGRGWKKGRQKAIIKLDLYKL